MAVSEMESIGFGSVGEPLEVPCISKIDGTPDRSMLQVGNVYCRNVEVEQTRGPPSSLCGDQDAGKN